MKKSIVMGKHKTNREKKLLIDEEKNLVIEQALHFSKKRFKKFDEIIVQLFEKEDLSAFFSDNRIRKIHTCFNNSSGKNSLSLRGLLKDVFIYLNKNSELISDEVYIHAVFNMVQFRAHWRKDLFLWRARSKQPANQVKELVDYLFCLYRVPEFLFKAFYEQNNKLYILWLIHLGCGRKVKEMSNIPIPFTQKAGHYFLQAPADLSIAEALRWGQVRGMGGSVQLAQRVVYSWIGTKPYGDENFWEAFLQLLVRSGMFNYDKLTEVIDYVREAKREDVNYNLKGRTLQSLVRQSDIWHNRFSGLKANQFWRPCGIDGYKIEKKDHVVVLEELTESKRLIEEGKKMRHCVGSYAFYCAKGKSAIFSLRKYSSEILLETMATIEVNLSLKRVVQAKAKMNKQVSDEARKYLDAWANKQELTVSPYL